MRELTDLRKFTGESGGTHGLDDVTNGTIQLHYVYSHQPTHLIKMGPYPYCKYHGFMLKVSPEGIWRCSVTETFRKVGGGEISTNHGCYYDNRP